MRAIVPIFLIIFFSTVSFAQSDDEALEQVYSSAQQLLEDGSYKQALLDYTKLINSGFENDAIWVKRGLAHYYLEEYPQALNDFDEAYKRQVRSGELLGYRALTKHNLDDENGAITGFEQAFAAGFKNTQAAYIIGNAYFQKKDYSAAIKYYSLGETWGADDPVLFNNRGKAYFLSDDNGKAIADFNKAIGINNEYAKARSNRALVAFTELQWDIAESDLTWLKSYDDHQFSADEYAMIGLIQLQNGSFTQARENLESAFKRSSEWEGLYKALAETYAQTDSPDKAIQMYQTSLEKEGDDTEVYEALAKLYYLENKFATSKKYSKDALDRQSSKPGIKEIFGLSAYHEGDRDEALPILTAVSATSTNDEVHEALAQIHFDKAAYAEAIVALKKSSRAGNIIPLLEMESTALYELGEYEKALQPLGSWKEADPTNIDPWLLSTRANMIIADYEAAENDIKRAIQLDESSFETNALYGEALLMNMQYEQASKYLEKACDIKSDIQTHAFLGLAQYRLSQFEKAYANLKLAANAKKLSTEGLNDLTISAFESGKYQEAVAYAKKAVADGLDEKRILFVRGMSLYHTQDYEAAKADLLLDVENGQKDARAFIALGAIAFGDKEYQQAISWYSKGIALGNPEKEVYLNRGEAYAALENYSEAISDFTHILTEDKDHDKARFARGKSYFAVKQYDEATSDLLLVNNKSLDLPVNEIIALSYARTNAPRAGEYLEKSIQLRTESGEIYFHAGRIEAEAGEWQKAIARLDIAEEKKYKEAALYEVRGAAHFTGKQYAECLQDLKRSGENKRLIGLSHYHLGSYPEAISSLTQVESLDSEGLIALGDAFFNVEKWIEAKNIYDELIASGNADAVVYRNRGLVFAGMKQWESAKTDLHRSLEMDPGNERAVKALAEVHFALGENAQLISLYEQHKETKGLILFAGLSYYAEKDYDKAQPLLEEVVRAGAGDSRTEGALGHIQYMNGAYEEAVRSLTNALGSDDSQTEWRQWKGLSLFALEKYNEALPLLETAISEGIQDPETFYAAGAAAYENSDNEQAIKRLEQARAAGYEAPEADFRLGNAYFKLSQYSQAVASYDLAVTGGLQSAILWNNRGKALANLEEWDKAISSYDEALAIDPNYLRALENRGSTHYELENYEAAAGDLRQVINLDEEEDGSIRFMLAETYVQLSEDRKAIVYYSESMRRGKESAEIYFKRGSCYSRIEDMENALSDLNQAYNAGKKDAELFLERANVNIRLDNSRAAMNDLNEAISREDTHADAYFNRGYLHELNENYSEAIKDYAKTIELNPEDDVAFYSLANSLVSQGNVSGALSPINKAIELKPENGGYYKVNGNILYRLERAEEACDQWRKAVELGDQKASFYINQYCD